MILNIFSRDFSDVRAPTNQLVCDMNMQNIPDVFSPKYIDPMADFGFKKIFKESGKKQLLIRPLNAIFGLDIADIEIRDGERMGDTPDDRNACFDLFCVASDGKRFIVEVQLLRQEHFLERAVYYTTFPIAEAARKGLDSARAWNYDFPPVFFLGLLNFDFRELHGQRTSDADQFIRRFSLRNDRTGELMTDRLRFAFLEIRRFDKKKEKCEDFEDQFLYMMKNMPTFAETPDVWADPYFRTMLDEAEFARMSRQQKEQYRKEMRRDWDYKNTMDYAIARGKEEGRAEGKAEGLVEGLAEGTAKGKAAEQQRIARRLLAAGLSVELIAESTDLPVEQVLALQGA